MSCAASICASAARYAASSPLSGQFLAHLYTWSIANGFAVLACRHPHSGGSEIPFLASRLFTVSCSASTAFTASLTRFASSAFSAPRRSASAALAASALIRALSSAVGSAAAAATSASSASTAAAQSFDVSLARSAVLARSRRRAASRLWLSAYNSFVARTRPALSVGLAAFVAPAGGRLLGGSRECGRRREREQRAMRGGDAVRLGCHQRLER